MCYKRGVGIRRQRSRRAFQDCGDCTFGCGDFYARKVDLVLPSGRSYYNTCAGGCVSILLVLVLLVILLLHISELMDDNKFVVQQALAKGWFTETDIFPPKEIKGEVQVAIGLVDLMDRRGGSVLDATYGEIGVYERIIREDGGYTYTQLKSRPCFKEELGLD